MNLDSVIKRGCLPWRPRQDASDLDVWHEYEIPLTGTFRINGSLIVFTQVLESSQGFSAWAYSCIREDDLAGLDSFSTVDDLRDYVESLFQGREAVIALAKDDRLIDRWTRREVTEGLVPAVEAFLNDVISSVNRVDDAGVRVRAKLAALDEGLDGAQAELLATA
ncbi:hypothetical protein [Herbidospora sp. RD11066]